MIKPYTRAEISFDEIREIGHAGRNSCVHLVHDNQLDADIAVKQIAKSQLDATQFFAEAQRLYSSKHPNVVDIHYACQDADNIYIAMPYYPRGSLKDLINTKNLTLREIITYCTQFLAGLHNIHSKKAVHFDIKPDNILIDHKGEALISDFGQSKTTNLHGVAEQDQLYHKQLPPEAFTGYRFDLRFDIYQVGLTLYRMLNGNVDFYTQLSPFVDSNGHVVDRHGFKFAVTNGHFPDRDRFREHIPKKVREVVRKCLSVSPLDRYRNCLDLLNELAAVDHALDWTYSESPGTKQWTRGDGERTFELKYDGTRFAAQKVMNASRRVSIISDFTKPTLTKTELYRFFKDT